LNLSRERIDEILELWESLQRQTELKGSKLTEASQQQQFNRNVEDIEAWLSDIEAQLVSEDYGKVRRRADIQGGISRCVRLTGVCRRISIFGGEKLFIGTYGIDLSKRN